MAIATLTIDIVAKLANLQTSFDKAAQLSERNAKRIQDAFRNVGAVLKTAVAGFGIQQLTQAFNQVAQGVAAFKGVSEATGIAVEELSKLEPIARQAGLTLDDVGNISLKLSKALSGVDDESRGAGKALAQIGINLQQFRQLGAAEQVQTLARALNKFADDGNKAAIGQAILGREWQRASGYLKDLAEAGELNATVTAEAAEQADAYAKAIERLKLQIVELARGPILTSITFVSNEIGRLADAAEAFGGKWAGFLFNLELGQFDDAAVAVNQLNDKIVDLQRTLEADPASATREQRKELDRLIKSREFFILQLRRQQEMQRQMNRPSAGAFVGTTSGGGGTSARQSDADRFLESLQKQAIAANYTAEQILRIEAAQRGVADAAEPWIRSIVAAKEAAEDTRQINEFLADDAKRFVDEQTQALEKLMDVGDEVRIAGDAINDTLLDTKDIARDLGLTFSSAFEDAIVQGGNLRDILRGLEQDILRIITRKLVTEPLANAVGGIDFGSLLGSFFGGGKASGGPVMGGTPYLVGEKGPEIFVPNSSGQIIPNNRAGRSTVINVNVPAGTSGATAQQIAATVARTLAIADARLN